jgi:hypothetical protein
MEEKNTKKQGYSINKLFKESLTEKILENDIEKRKVGLQNQIDPSLLRKSPITPGDERKIVSEEAKEMAQRITKLTDTAQKVAAKQILNGEIDTSKPLASQLNGSKKKPLEFVAKRRRTVEELMNYGMSQSQIAEAIGEKLDNIAQDIRFIRKKRTENAKAKKDPQDPILESYDKMLADLTIEYLNTTNDNSKSKIANSKIRTLESKWKYMLVRGLIKKQKAGTVIGKKDLSNMSTAQLSNLLSDMKHDTEDIKKDRASSNENDLSVQHGEVKRLFQHEKVDIPPYLLDDEDETDEMEDLEEIEKAIQDIDNSGVL